MLQNIITGVVIGLVLLSLVLAGYYNDKDKYERRSRND